MRKKDDEIKKLSRLLGKAERLCTEAVAQKQALTLEKDNAEKVLKEQVVAAVRNAAVMKEERDTKQALLREKDAYVTKLELRLQNETRERKDATVALRRTQRELE